MQCRPSSPPSRSLTSRPRQRGFTLPEILIVIVMISVLALVAIPRFSTASNKRHVESARMRVAAALSTARQAAIQKGEPVQFRLKLHQVRVFTASDTTRNLLSPVPLDTLYNVTTTVDGVTGEFNVLFNARGFANVPATRIIRLTRTGVPNDSVMVLTTGRVQR
jgi:type II secretion system protein H